MHNGIQYLQDYRILIHPRCVNFLSEIGSYAWRKDKLGNTLNEPEDSNNHLMDAMRYAMEPYIRKRITNPPERRRYVPDGVTAKRYARRLGHMIWIAAIAAAGWILAAFFMRYSGGAGKRRPQGGKAEIRRCKGHG